ncbi:amino acid aminotransferase [Sphingomonas oryzagri]|uniref:Amino acid aminotransferase n=1 Tax=Sphingomonas oryzagri TaxID=3042314 RepID=A0ABT6MYQ9_9SPHN|nr:amino acid aminotransferase [Sphingomonas oryzagri]MDH7637624.1 amino acid aminotransferase [Sphingomonas oryzagri]
MGGNPSLIECYTSLFDGLTEQPSDTLLGLISAFRSDPRPGKIDLGVGVYRDNEGRTPVLRAVKESERRLVEGQLTKAYLGAEGDVGFVEALMPVIFGLQPYGARLCGLQTPGGTGALRLAAELIARARPGARVWLGTPTWPNHSQIMASAHLAIEEYPHFDVTTQRLRFDRVMAAIEAANAGDVLLLHGCCHNPTGADFDDSQWIAIARAMASRGVLPLIDLAYQGLGRGLEEDVAGVRATLDIVGEGFIAYSCDKNFGLYRERVGALYALSRSTGQAGIVQSNLLALARANWSMPPDHGAAIVRIILEDATLAADWRTELSDMACRMREIRTLLAQAKANLAPIAHQQGMFSTLPLTPMMVARLRDEQRVYLPSSGRINIAGLTRDTVPAFVRALLWLA